MYQLPPWLTAQQAMGGGYPMFGQQMDAQSLQIPSQAMPISMTLPQGQGTNMMPPVGYGGNGSNPYQNDPASQYWNLSQQQSGVDPQKMQAILQAASLMSRGRGQAQGPQGESAPVHVTTADPQGNPNYQPSWYQMLMLPRGLAALGRR